MATAGEETRMRRLRSIVMFFGLLLAGAGGCTSSPYQEGLDLLNRGEYQKGAEFFLKLTELRPQDPRAFHELGYAYSRLEMYDDALTAVNKAIELKPDYAEALGNLGYVQLQRKRPSEAEEPLLKAIKLNPNCEGCHANLAWVYHHLRQPDKAKAELTEAIRLSAGKRDYADLAKTLK
jgi:Flp pilus assembly protein TadD